MKKLNLLKIFLLLPLSFFNATLFAHDGHAVPKPKNLDDLLALSKPLGWNIEKTQINSNTYEYFVGSFDNIEAANLKLNFVKNNGFENAFIYAEYNGQRITLEQSKEVLKSN